MARIINGKVIRTCNKCGITNDLIEFLHTKNSKNGKYYTHNICLPCRKEYNYKVRYRNISKEEHCKRSQKWNIENRERYNARRRIKNKFFNGCIDNFYLTEVL